MQLQKCIGSAVFAMGPEKFLTLVPLSLDENNYTYSNIWLVPILKKCISGASLAYYMEHIMPLAKSFKKASRKGIFQHVEHLYLLIANVFFLLCSFTALHYFLHGVVFFKSFSFRLKMEEAGKDFFLPMAIPLPCPFGCFGYFLSFPSLFGSRCMTLQYLLIPVEIFYI